MRLPLRGFSLPPLHFPKLTPNFLLFPVLSTPTPFIESTICYHNMHERVRRHPVIFLNRLLGAFTMRRRGQWYSTSWLGPRGKKKLDPENGLSIQYWGVIYFASETGMPVEIFIPETDRGLHQYSLPLGLIQRCATLKRQQVANSTSYVWNPTSMLVKVNKSLK